MSDRRGMIQFAGSDPFPASRLDMSYDAPSGLVLYRYTPAADIDAYEIVRIWSRAVLRPETYDQPLPDWLNDTGLRRHFQVVQDPAPE